jgi:hypothetical protein
MVYFLRVSDYVAAPRAWVEKMNSISTMLMAQAEERGHPQIALMIVIIHSIDIENRNPFEHYTSESIPVTAANTHVEPIHSTDFHSKSSNGFLIHYMNDDKLHYILGLAAGSGEPYPYHNVFLHFTTIANAQSIVANGRFFAEYEIPDANRFGDYEAYNESDSDNMYEDDELSEIEVEDEGLHYLSP